MSDRIFLPTLLCLFLLHSTLPLEVKSQERVAKFYYRNDNRSEVRVGNDVWVGNIVWQSDSIFEGATFLVYTTADVDRKIRDINNSINQKFSQVNNALDANEQALRETISETERRLNDTVITEIRELPQRLLSKEAQTAIQQAVLAEIRPELDSLGTVLREEIDQIRVDLQAQIDEVQ